MMFVGHLKSGVHFSTGFPDRTSKISPIMSHEHHTTPLTFPALAEKRMYNEVPPPAFLERVSPTTVLAKKGIRYSLLLFVQCNTFLQTPDSTSATSQL